MKSASARKIAHKHGRAQSAMEYLMTYGWAILIIAVVLGALFQLGVFSSANFSARAKAGACQVERLGTPGSPSYNIALAGDCTGELPQYVTTTTSTTSITTTLDYNPGFGAVGLWIYPTDQSAEYDIFETDFGSGAAQADNLVNLNANGAGSLQYELIGCTSSEFYDAIGVTIPTDSWSFIALTFNSLGDPVFFVNGNAYYTSKTTQSHMCGSPSGITPTTVSLGGVDGEMSNIQLYNYSLSTSELDALYTEGIGGAPVRPQNITAWWQLNGDTNDYSGLTQDAQVTSGSIGYMADYLSQYKSP
ncbi:MAG: LamG domain-containing protein [Candidatus Marsarchaeota archaeon]|nr:LamG domain-containing protein [Candidatus Marsarchaeota archaeon]